MTLITSAMRRLLAGDEAMRALDPNGVRPRSAARVPRAIRARCAGNAVQSHQACHNAVEAADLETKCARLTRDLDAVLAKEEPTPYVRDTFPADAVMPQVMRGFA